MPPRKRARGGRSRPTAASTSTRGAAPATPGPRTRSSTTPATPATSTTAPLSASALAAASASASTSRSPSVSVDATASGSGTPGTTPIPIPRATLSPTKEGGSSQTRREPSPILTQAPTQRRRRGTATATTGAPTPARHVYRTRHRRIVRGPELAAAEGGESDLVPPSDDEEYEEWRAVREVERREGDEEPGPSKRGHDPQKERDERQEKSERHAEGRVGSETEDLRVVRRQHPPDPRPHLDGALSQGRKLFVPLFDNWAGSPPLSDDDSSAIPTADKRKAVLEAVLPGRVELSPDSDSDISPPPGAQQSGSLQLHSDVLPSPVEPSLAGPSRPTRAHQRRASLTLPPPPTKVPHRSSPQPQLEPPESQLSRDAYVQAQSKTPRVRPPDVDIDPGNSPPDAVDHHGMDLDPGFESGASPEGDLYSHQQEEEDAQTRPPLDIGGISTPIPVDSLHLQNTGRSVGSAQRGATQVDKRDNHGHGSASPAPALSDIDPLDLLRSSPDPPLSRSPSVPPSPSRTSSAAALRPSGSRSAPAPGPSGYPSVAALAPLPSGSGGPQPSLRPAPHSPPARPPDARPLSPALAPAPPAARPLSPVPQVPFDPALIQFRSARTFRSRTALQLQPYTRERQAYEIALKRGGLAKGRRAVAPVAEVRAASDADSGNDSASTAEDGDEDATPPDAIVIGATQEQAKRIRKTREPKPLVDTDYDEYFIRFGEVADEEDEAVARRLQVIARERIRAEREEKKAERRAERTKRQFEALIAGKDKSGRDERREKDKEERQREKEDREAQRRERKKRERKTVAKDTDMREKDRRTQRATKDKEDKAAREKNRSSLNTDTRAPRTNDQKPRGPTTYSRQHRQQRARALSDSSSLSDAPPTPRGKPPPPVEREDIVRDQSTPTRTPPRHISPLRSARASPVARLSLPLSPPQFDDGAFDLPFFDDPPASSHSNHNDFFNTDVFDTEESLELPTSTRRPHSAKRRRLPSSSDHSGSDTEPSRTTPAEPDKRRRIAERMLPRVMLNRLAREQADRQRERPGARRRRDSDSPVRPGHAVVRRGQGAGLDDVADLFDRDSSPPVEHEAEEADAHGSEDSEGGTDAPIVISDSSGTEAEEDNRAEGLARLRDGDFEGIVHGRVRRDAPRQLEPERRRHKPRRPPLDLRRRHASSYASPPSSPRRLVQTRLDFPVVDQQAESRRDRRTSKSKGKRRAGRHKGARRPAIRLDDHVIFATDDFAWSDSEVEVREVRDARPGRSERPERDERAERAERPGCAERPGRPDGKGRDRPKAPFARTTSRGTDIRDMLVRQRTTASPSPAPPQRAQLDEGVGRARSWANFDRFPIDFDITPLPSGVYCSTATVAGSGRLETFLKMLRGEQVEPEEPKPCTAYGVDLHAGMGIDEAVAVVPVIVEGLHAALRAFGAGTTETVRKPDLSPLLFFRDYLAHTNDDEAHARAWAELQVLTERLDEMTLSGERHDRPLLEQVLLTRYALLEIAVIASPAHVVPIAASIVRLLLAHGLDRTMRPLKRILRGEADTPEVGDTTVALWIAVGHVLSAHDARTPAPSASSSRSDGNDSFSAAVSDALDARFRGEVGPLAAERVWFLVFSLCALAQFGSDGAVCAAYTPYPRWALVRRALGLIKVAHSAEAEEAAHVDQLQGRDRYIKTMVLRCLRLSSTWQWSFNRSSFSVVTRDLGMIFKDRAQRNLPTEPPADFPAFITQFDISLTADDGHDSRRASAFELYLRLACVAASDVIGAAQALSAAQDAERAVQRLIMSIFPLSAVPFTRANPPTQRQLAALVNRYSTMVVACYFSPGLLPWLLANSAQWLAFERADFDSRQVVIRGLMYLAVACRHHDTPLDAVVARLADILATLQGELEQIGRPNTPLHFPTRVEIERTMVLVVACFRQIIVHSGYAERAEPVYPDPTLLHECWTARIFELDLAKDVKSGLEIVSTIQAFLDARALALPARARQARNSRANDSLDDYPSLGFDFDAVDLAALGGDEGELAALPQDPVETADAKFAEIIRDTICPKIYRLLSDMLAEEEVGDQDKDKQVARGRTHDHREDRSERQILVNRLTKCWADCAGVVVVDHGLMDWSSYVGPFGSQSWSRLPTELGRIQVGLHFMLNVCALDPAAFRVHDEEFLGLVFRSIVTDRLTVEHKYLSALFGIPGVLDHPLLVGVRGVLQVAAGPNADDEDDDSSLGLPFTRASFMAVRLPLLTAVFANIGPLLGSRHTPAGTKTLVYRCVNLLVGALALYEARIDTRRVLHREGYRAFAGEVVHALRSQAGVYISEASVPALKAVVWT